MRKNRDFIPILERKNIRRGRPGPLAKKNLFWTWIAYSFHGSEITHLRKLVVKEKIINLQVENDSYGRGEPLLRHKRRSTERVECLHVIFVSHKSLEISECLTNDF